MINIIDDKSTLDSGDLNEFNVDYELLLKKIKKAIRKNHSCYVENQITKHDLHYLISYELCRSKRDDKIKAFRHANYDTILKIGTILKSLDERVRKKT